MRTFLVHLVVFLLAASAFADDATSDHYPFILLLGDERPTIELFDPSTGQRHLAMLFNGWKTPSPGAHGERIVEYECFISNQACSDPQHYGIAGEDRHPVTVSHWHIYKDYPLSSFYFQYDSGRYGLSVPLTAEQAAQISDSGIFISGSSLTARDMGGFPILARRVASATTMANCHVFALACLGYGAFSGTMLGDMGDKDAVLNRFCYSLSWGQATSMSIMSEDFHSSFIMQTQRDALPVGDGKCYIKELVFKEQWYGAGYSFVYDDPGRWIAYPFSSMGSPLCYVSRNRENLHE